jgi:hypothetical protein
MAKFAGIAYTPPKKFHPVTITKLMISEFWIIFLYSQFTYRLFSWIRYMHFSYFSFIN